MLLKSTDKYHTVTLYGGSRGKMIKKIYQMAFGWNIILLMKN